ncbi:MAG: Eco57I restriction-modification methylase domain-containing protein [Prolixibacteraceae bacterium]|nr:Eco57I restriction-modification methylase domain-containing protein [Prolixibacteraceae bacterium]
MALFQRTVEQKYLKQLDSELINSKYLEFKSYFGNTDIQENIRNSKEEQYQEGFLRELFVKILGYKLNPTPGFNLTTEYKNIKDSKKADGAIIINERVKAVIELKGTNTTDLSKIETQAFGYKNNQSGCVYVITSNFEKLRFYIDNAIEHIEFNLFTLSKTDFGILYLCLSFESIEKGIPKKVKEESLSQEDVITRKLYQDYSLFKRELHQNLVSLNPQYDSLTLFKKSQKLLDRFLFLFFAEDRHLLPPNSVRLILNDWRDLQERDVEIPLYQRFKKYFEYLNTGYKGKRYDVFAYNGGLFKPDEVLDSILIDDELLFKHAYKLSEYDFVSEIDVNILGHIFENSLNELDEINAQLAGEEIDKTKTRRKKDGVFYTPKYITKYIVENTVGKLCNEKKAELQIIEEEYTTDKKRQLKTKQALLEKLKTYQNWLLQLTICDPACGSGAFLNQALDFLITEHRYIDELQAKILGVPIIFSDIEKSILENNLFGVDLNEESVEIAKLSLWLRTAQPNRKLNDLNNNIKCGNSLISDPAVAGNKAFDWEREFPQVFGRKEIETPFIEVPKDKTPDYLKLIKEKSLEAQSKAEQALTLSKEAAELSKKVYEYAEKLGNVSDDDSLYGIRKGGFDVVIGNPPYVQLQSMGEMSEKLKNCGYETFDKGADLYCLFTERGYKLLKNGGIQSFIMPNKWMLVAYGKPLRKFLSKTGLRQILNFGDIQFFAEATTYVCIFVTQKSERKDNVKVLSINQKTYHGDFMTEVESNLYDYPTSKFGESEWSIQPYNDAQKLEQMKLMGTELKNLPINTYRGILTGYNEAFYIDEETRQSLIYADAKSAELIRPMVRGRDISAYINSGSEFLINAHNGIKEKNPPLPPIRIDDYPAIKKHLDSFYPSLEKRGDKGDTPYNLRNCAYLEEFSKPKIIYPNMTSVFPFMYDESGMLGNDKSFILTAQDDSISLLFLTALFNSSLAKLWIWHNCPELQGGTREIRKVYFEHFPVPQANEEQTDTLAKYATERAQLTISLQTLCSKFTRNIQREYNLEKLSAKLENWFQISFKEFLKELEKSKIKLTLSQKAEWEDYFHQESNKALAIKQQIDTTDKEIDQMVYGLYGLSEE